MEQFGIPLREIGDRFTRSELVFVAWRSQEQHYHFKKKLHKMDDDDDNKFKGEIHPSKKRKKYHDGIGPERMPDRFFDENGDFNLSKVPGEDARRYFEHVLRIPMPPGVSKIRYEDDTSNQIRQAYNIRS